jgi:hypothetical protein
VTARGDLRAELLALIAEDAATRERLAADGALFRGYAAEMEAVHRTNAARLRAIVAELEGWPGRSIVGDDGASAAWLIAQHAIGEPDTMRAMLPLLEAAVAGGEADASELACLVDRVRLLEGRPQLYGTQTDWDPTGRWMVPAGSIEDPDRVDERRQAVGLPPIDWRVPPEPDEPPPEDLAAREREMNEWARRVGWR